MQIHHPQTLSTAFVADGQGGYGLTRAVTADEIVTAAKALMSQRFLKRDFLGSSHIARHFFRTQLAELEHEVFCVAFLNTKLHLLCCETMFRGTVDKASVYPREVAKRALSLNAKSVFIAHNHPSGESEPSQDDHTVTQHLKKALGLLDIQLLDHFIVAGVEAISFVESGWL